MGRSQRHMMLEQNTSSNGEVYSEGQVAPGVLLQYEGEPPDAMALARGTHADTFIVETHGPDLSGMPQPVGPDGGPLQGSYTMGVIPEAAGGGGSTTTPNPPRDETPTLTSINPTEAAIGDPDLTLTMTGTFFTETSVINFNGGDEPTTFVSDTELTTGVKPSTASVPGSYPVLVKQGAFSTEPQMFTFTEAGGEPIPEEEGVKNSPAETRDFPIGPVGVVKIEKVGDELHIDLTTSDAVQAGDFIHIEATGRSELNGEYRVNATAGSTIHVSVGDIELLQAITERGRVTIVAGGE